METFLCTHFFAQETLKRIAWLANTIGMSISNKQRVLHFIGLLGIHIYESRAL